MIDFITFLYAGPASPVFCSWTSNLNVCHTSNPTYSPKTTCLGKDQVPAQSEIMDTNREVRISVRAYEIYEERIRM